MSDLTTNFLLLNASVNKNISVVVTIEGLLDKLSNRALFTAVRYGDTGIHYGDSGLVYGALRLLSGSQDILSLEGSSLVISQRLEPEQGRGAISTINLAFIDRNSFMTQVISPGVLLDDILGKIVRVELGYQEISYPQDFFIVFRGIVTAVDYRSGLVTMQISDSNLKRNQNTFFTSETELDGAINSSVQVIPVVSTGGFHQEIIAPFPLQFPGDAFHPAGYDTAVRTFIRIQDEYIEYTPPGIYGNNFGSTPSNPVTRGAQPTVGGSPIPLTVPSVAASHSDGESVKSRMLLADHAIDMALKIMLSGWNGDWITGQPVQSLVTTGESPPLPTAIANAIVFADTINTDKEYGIVIGDRVTISGSITSSNNVTVKIVDIQNLGDFLNRVVIVDSHDITGAPVSLVPDTSSGITVSFRSQFDSYPVTAGLKLTPEDVDVQGHLDLKRQFLESPENSYAFIIDAQDSGKAFIEKEIYLPLGVYSLTRRGRLSARLTKPPLASAGIVFLNQTNILNPQELRPARATNTRKFFNEIQYFFDVQDDNSNFLSESVTLDSESLTIIGISSVLTIQSKGARSFLSTDMTALIKRRSNFLLSRYKRGATEISCTVNYGTGVQIEAGDVVALDGTNLSIANFSNGTRNFGVQLFEVLDRGLDIKNGKANLKLVSGVGAEATDRYAVVAPSSVVASGSTTTSVVIQDSFSSANPIFPGAEFKKWENYVGLPISIHSEDYATVYSATFIGFDPSNDYVMQVNPPLPMAPPAGFVVDIPYYPTSSDPLVDSAYKIIHAHLDPELTVVSGISTTQFTVSAPDAAKVLDGAMIRVHSSDFSIDSLDQTVTNVTGTTITCSNLGFTPSAGQLVELVGFLDGGGAYRVI